jgi:hypothetical protein
VAIVGGAKKENGHLEDFKLLPYSDNLDLSYFYQKANEKGFDNNSSKQALIDCFDKDKEKQVWILYSGGLPIGSVGAHSFYDIMGPGSYRILARTCIIKTVINRARTLRDIKTHSHIVDRYYVPQCLTWANTDKVYATSNMSSVASQRLVHTIYFPAMESLGLVSKVKEVEYRKQVQTVWQYHPEEFLKSLYKHQPDII